MALSLLVTLFLSDHHFKVPLPGFSCSHHHSVIPWAPVGVSSLLTVPVSVCPHTFPQLPSSVCYCLSPQVSVLNKLLPCALGSHIQSSKLLCSETEPSHSPPHLLLILFTSVKSAFHPPAWDLGIALAASLCPPLGVNQLPGLVMSASLISLKFTSFSLFLLQLPWVRLPSAPAWITAKPFFEPSLGLQPRSSICSYPVARANLIMSLPWLIVFNFEAVTPLLNTQGP